MKNEQVEQSTIPTAVIQLGSKLKMRHWLVLQTESKTYPGLRWLDEAKTLLRIPWKHGSNGGWNAEDGKLFENWAFYSGKFDPTRQKNSRKFKANFRCALRSLSDVVEVKEKSRKTGKDACKVFRFMEEKKRRNLGGLKASMTAPTIGSLSGSHNNHHHHHHHPNLLLHHHHHHKTHQPMATTSAPTAATSSTTAAVAHGCDKIQTSSSSSTFSNCCNNQFIFNNYIATPAFTPTAATASTLVKLEPHQLHAGRYHHQHHSGYQSGKTEFPSASGVQYHHQPLSQSLGHDFDRHHYHYYHHYFNNGSGYSNSFAGSSGYVVANGGIVENDWGDITEFLKEEAEQMTINRSYYNFQ